MLHWAQVSSLISSYTEISTKCSVPLHLLLKSTAMIFLVLSDIYNFNTGLFICFILLQLKGQHCQTVIHHFGSDWNILTAIVCSYHPRAFLNHTIHFYITTDLQKSLSEDIFLPNSYSKQSQATWPSNDLPMRVTVYLHSSAHSHTHTHTRVHLLNDTTGTTLFYSAFFFLLHYSYHFVLIMWLRVDMRVGHFANKYQWISWHVHEH